MPEQEQRQSLPSPQEQQKLALIEAEAAGLEENGAASISPTIIIPPVVIAIVMSLLLAVVYGITKEPIAEAKKADKRDKLAQVMPKFDNDPLDLEQALSDAAPGTPGNVMLYTGTVPDGVSGYGVTSAVGTGYSGYFSIVFGLDIQGTITSVKILESMETPGLGSKAALPGFIDQFQGKRLDNFKFMVTKDGGDVDAITGATITSRAVSLALKQGLEAFEANKPGGDAPAAAEPTDDGQVDDPPVDDSILQDAADDVAGEIKDYLDGETEGQDG